MTIYGSYVNRPSDYYPRPIANAFLLRQPSENFKLNEYKFQPITIPINTKIQLQSPTNTPVIWGSNSNNITLLQDGTVISETYCEGIITAVDKQNRYIMPFKVVYAP